MLFRCAIILGERLASMKSSRPPLAQLLRDAAKRAGYTVSRDLARDLILDKGAQPSTETVRRCLNGQSIPGDHILERLCQLLGVNYEEARALAVEARREQAKRNVALDDPQFRGCIDAWVRDPEFALTGKNWLHDPQFSFLMKLYDLMAPAQRAELFNTAVRIQQKAKARAAAA